MNIDMKLDISKLSPAPWHVVDWAWSNTPKEVIADNDENVVESHTDMVMCAMARNFLEITMRRGWGIKLCSDGRWMVLHNEEIPIHVGLAGWSDPFTAVIETEKWLVANMEGKQ